MSHEDEMKVTEEIISAMKKLTDIQRKLYRQAKPNRDELFVEIGEVWEMLNGAANKLLQI